MPKITYKNTSLELRNQIAEVINDYFYPTEKLPSQGRVRARYNKATKLSKIIKVSPRTLYRALNPGEGGMFLETATIILDACGKKLIVVDKDCNEE